MKVLTPQEVEAGIKDTSQRKREYVERIVDEFNYAVANSIYHYLSTEDIKYVFYPADERYCDKMNFIDALTEIKRAGWDAEYEQKTCAHGWFNSIKITK